MMIDQDNPVIEFTAEDRCSRCGAQALVLAHCTELGEFLFCAHHIREHASALENAGFMLVFDLVAAENTGFTDVERILS